jgi:hypothetical protein
VVLGLLAAWIQDDLEHVVGYTIVADAGFVVLGLGVLDPAIWEPVRTWILVLVVARSAFAAWAVALHGGFGTRRLPELTGWARRAPALALGLVGIVAATIGWPGLPTWDARASIATLGLPPALAFVVTVAPLAGLSIHLRILAIGLRPVGPDVKSGRGERPGWPVPWPARPMVGLSSTERLFEHLAHAGHATLDVLWTLPAAIRLNRMPLASLAVLALAGLAFAVSAGGLGVPAAARAVPAISEPGPNGPGSGPAGSPGPSASPEPGASQPTA